MHAEIIVKGIVQGVGFRPFIYRIATENKLLGYVRNRGDASVEIVVQGKKDDFNRFMFALKEKKPQLSQIFDLSIRYSKEINEFTKFSIIKSLDRGYQVGSVIPYDLSICDRCLKEVRDVRNRRYEYFFTTCTECGPRYTIIKDLPYDRSNTTMQDFAMCNECKKEYESPINRRFHAQTIACNKCGPSIFLASPDGQVLDILDPIREVGKLLEEGAIVAIKGNGGFHIATSTLKSEPIMRLRKAKHRSQKPFAIMARNIEIINSFAEINPTEEVLLSSNVRPIVLLTKRKEYYLSNQVSPGLHNVGVMLPYTGLHYMLFDSNKEPAFIMTSANHPSEPIVIDNKEALKKLGRQVDYFLFHNRDIAQRCDDSVLRAHDKNISIIRRSRGYAPTPILLGNSKKYCTLGVGAKENVNSCILLKNKAFVSQYIGDVENIEILEYLRKATINILKLTNSSIEGVACDLHPQFSTRNLAEEFAVQFNCPVLKVQHHYSHILSLMGEAGINDIVGIVCDGFGYGDDGNSWGGEVLHCTSKGYTRLGHLEEQPMIGGDLAAKYPLRMVAGILNNSLDVNKWIFSKSKYFPYGENEVKLIFSQLRKNQSSVTTSCGRILDAIGALLGICYERTYEGEPAMKLESTAIGGENILKLLPKIKGNIIDTTSLVLEIFRNLNKYSANDLAYSAESYIAESLALVGIDAATHKGLEIIGFSGGVAYNNHITQVIREKVEENGLKFLTHDQVPAGDGGISLGQAIAISNFLEF